MGAAGLLDAAPSSAVEQPLETTAVRLANSGLCIAPQYLAEELLHAEGFTNVGYLDTPVGDRPRKIAHGEIDFTLDYASSLVPAIDAGEPITEGAAASPKSGL
jgi:NitT/TauT family transport system substrate-binding protein